VRNTCPNDSSLQFWRRHSFEHTAAQTVLGEEGREFNRPLHVRRIQGQLQYINNLAVVDLAQKRNEKKGALLEALADLFSRVLADQPVIYQDVAIFSNHPHSSKG
jgi:hypothetical protein